MRELNRLGITSVIDAGGGFQNYPEDYQVIEQLHKNGELTVRIAYNLFTQKPKGELADFQRWTGMLKPRQGDDYLRHNGAGEMLVFSAADFEDFLEPRPDLPGVMEQELKPVVSLLAKNRWPFRLHATYDETITRALNVYEEVNREDSASGPALVHRPRGNHLAAQHGSDRGAGRRDRDSAPHGISGRVFPRPLRKHRNEANAADPGDAADRTAGRSRDRRHARRQLQPVCVALLAGDGEDGRRPIDVRRGSPAGSNGSSAPVDRGQQLVLHRTRVERLDRSGAIGGPRGAFRGLFFGGRRRDQEPRIGADDRRRQAGVRRRGVRRSGAAASTGAAGMVSGRGVWRLLQTRDSAGCGVLVPGACASWRTSASRSAIGGGFGCLCWAF